MVNPNVGRSVVDGLLTEAIRVRAGLEQARLLLLRAVGYCMVFVVAVLCTWADSGVTIKVIEDLII